MASKKQIKQTCACCGKDKRLEDYYASSSPFHKNTSKLHVCKSCILEHAEKNIGNIILIKDALRRIDKPFLVSVWQSSSQEAENTGKSPFGIYMKNLGLRQYRDLTWGDSDHQNENITSPSISEIMLQDDDLSQDDVKDMISFWGRGFQVQDYLWLTQEFTDFTNRYECDSKGMELLIKQICLTELDIEKRREAGEKVDQQLKTLQDLLGSSNLKPVQETGANAAEQESFGTLLKKYENEKPVPDPDPRWRDVDNIGKYVRVFFLGHLSRMLGLKNDYADEYWDEVNKYTIDEPTDDEQEVDIE